MTAKVVVLDPGHGGPGNHGTSDPAQAFYEAEWVLDFTEQFLSDAIEQEAVEQKKSLVVVQTRHTDKTLSLTERGEISGRLGASLAVSIHTNANDSALARGAMIFVNRSELVDPAQRIVANMPKALQRRRGVFDMSKIENRIAWPRVWNVLKAHPCPAMLLECGFRTNPEDFKLLQDNTIKARIAVAVADEVVSIL